jgi:hypothetical protein
MAQLYGKKTSDGLPKALECTDDGDLNIAVIAQAPPTTLPLPTGAATSALQTAGNVSLAAIATKKVQLHAKIDFSSASAQTIIAAPGAGNRIRLTRLSMSSGGTPQVNVEIDMKSGANSIETVKGSVMAFDYPEHRNLGTNEAFVVQCTTADRVIGGVDYYVEAV